MIEEEITINLFVIILSFLIGLGVGYCIITRDSYNAVQNVSTWIDHTKSNHWINVSLYKELEQEYRELDKEYNQYRGFAKAYKELLENKESK